MTSPHDTTDIPEPANASPPPCRLCQLLHIADGHHPTGTPQQQHAFSRHEEICDACLAHDFTRADLRITLLKIFLLPAACLSIGLLLGGIAGPIAFAIARKNNGPLPFASTPLNITTYILAAALVIATGYYLYIQIASRLRPREAIPPAERLREQREFAEELYYLALWAALTRRPRYQRKMLARARKEGFTDPRRLDDPVFQNP